jgi:hypothetical protein
MGSIMSEDLDCDFLIRMAAIAVQGMPPDWVASGPILGALLALADLPICAAPHPGAARALEALGARLPVALAPEECAPESIDLLVLEDPAEFTPAWRQALAPGALIFARNAQGPVLESEGAVIAFLDFEAGVSLDLRAGCQSRHLRALVEECVRRPDLPAAIVRMAIVLQGRHAHLDLAGRAALWRDTPAAGLALGIVT